LLAPATFHRAANEFRLFILVDELSKKRVINTWSEAALLWLWILPCTIKFTSDDRQEIVGKYEHAISTQRAAIVPARLFSEHHQEHSDCELKGGDETLEDTFFCHCLIQNLMVAAGLKATHEILICHEPIPRLREEGFGKLGVNPENSCRLFELSRRQPRVTWQFLSSSNLVA